MKVLKTFWSDFFKGPLQLSLEKVGSSVEEFMIYAIIHHDHHFFCEWASESYDDGLAFDSVRTNIETSFQHLYEWTDTSKRMKIELRAAMKLIYFTGRNGVHDNVFELLKEEGLRHP